MANFTIPQLYDLAIRAGWPRAVAPLAAATAWVESSGNPAAASGTGPLGLWQIAEGHAAKLGLTDADRTDPLKNAQIALKLWQNRGGTGVAPEVAFADWWPYDRANAIQQRNFADALAIASKGGAAGQLPTLQGSLPTPGANPLDALGGLASGFAALAKDFASFATMAAWFVNPANDIRVLLGIFGLLFLGAGAWMLGREVRHGG